MESTSSQAPRRSPPECGRPDLALRLASGEELAGQFGDEMAAHAKGCASCSVRMSLVQQAERWLADHASSNRAAITSTAACPSAEQLYDFGRGPGALSLARGLEGRIQAHLVDCADCRGLVAKLATRPPAPLLDLAPRVVSSETGPERTVHTRPHLIDEDLVSRPAANHRWLSYAAAAAVVLGGFYLWKANRTSNGAERSNLAKGELGIGYPTPPLLRGDTASAMLFPGARVLATISADTTGTWHPLQFELAVRNGASGYRIRLSKAGSGAFGKAVPLKPFELTTPVYEVPEDTSRGLAIGRYTWEAWAVVNKLDQPLGQRDFEIVDSAPAREMLAKNMALAEPERSTAILRWLVEHEFNTDARAYARGLPPSKERDKFLSAIPGR